MIRHRAIKQLRGCMGGSVVTASSRSSSSCTDPIEQAVLMDYWLAALSAAAEDAVEQHLMTCDECGDRLRETIALADGLRMLARSGSLQVIVTDQFAQHAAETGLRVREYAPPRFETTRAGVTDRRGVRSYDS